MRNLRVLVNQSWCCPSQNTLGHDESSRQRSPTFPSFLSDAEEQRFQTFEDIMIEPANGTTRFLQALLDGKIDVRLATIMSPRFANAGLHNV